MSDEITLRALAQLVGPPYHAFRDLFLSGEHNFAAMAKETATDPDFRVPMIAQILQGWASHRDLYLQVSEEIASIDIAWRSKTVSGIVGIWDEYAWRAVNEYGPKILPLSWEAVLKDSETAPPWQTATFLAMMEVDQTPSSVAPAAYLMATTRDSMLSQRAAYLLSKLHRPSVNTALNDLNARISAIGSAVADVYNLID